MRLRLELLIRLDRDFLHAPVQFLGGEDRVLIRAGQLVDIAEMADRSCRRLPIVPNTVPSSFIL